MYSFSKFIKGALALVVALSVVACSGGDGGVRVQDPVAPAPAEPAGPSIVDVATEAGSFETLLAAASAAGLVETLSDQSASLTLFAPTDAAFEALFATMPEGAKDELLADAEALTSILTYHVLKGAVDIAAAGELAGTAVETFNGEKVALTIREDAYLYVNEAKVDPYDIMASNGVIHVIDKVLLPPEPDTSAADMTIVEIASANEDFETLVSAITAADLVGTLGNPDPAAKLTVFAPTDDAFAMLGDLGLAYLTDDLDRLTNTLLYHVIDGAVDSIDAAAAYNQSVTMKNGDSAEVTIENGMLMIGDATVVTKDIIASNGIIHVIDSVLMPPSAGPAPIAVEAAVAGAFNTLMTAVETADLTETLMAPDANLTVFAPTDDAFALLEPGTVDALLADIEALTDLLTYHIHDDTLSSGRLTLLTALPMLNNEDVAISEVDGVLMINDAKVIMADVEANNGVIHVIDKVLIPTGDPSEVNASDSFLLGTWVTSNELGSVGVGPAEFDTQWWNNNADVNAARTCFFDDEFTFGADGSLTIELQGSTWLEGWQGSDEGADICGVPVAPHDGSGNFTWTHDLETGELVLSGKGAYVGIAKVTNSGELQSPDAAPESITYTAYDNGDDTVTVTIQTADSGNWWQHKMVKIAELPVTGIVGSWTISDEVASLGVGPTEFDTQWWNNNADVNAARGCFFDDEYIFNADGTFEIDMQDSTWLEGWQDPTLADSCSAPVSPHDGAIANYVYDGEAETLTVTGVGAHIGIPKVNNGADVATPANAVAEIVYNAYLSEDENELVVTIQNEASGDWWQFKLVRSQ